MAVDPSISLGVKTPESPGPLEQYKGLLSLQNLMSENALRRQQIQTGIQTAANVAAEAKQRVLDQQDQATIQNMQGDPAFQKAYGSGDYQTIVSHLGGKVQPKTVDALYQQSLQAATSVATLTKDKQERLQSFHNALANGLSGLDPKDDDAASGQGRAFVSQLASDYPEFSDHLPQPSDITPGSVRDLIKTASARNGVTQAILDKIQATQKTGAEVKKEQALAANAEAETPGIRKVHQMLK